MDISDSTGHEDPILHQCPPPWQSRSRRAITGDKPAAKLMVTIGGVLLLIGVIFLLLGLGGIFSTICFFGVGIIVFGMIIMVISQSHATDHMDSWSIPLPYNRQLYDRIIFDIEHFLYSNRYHYVCQQESIPLMGPNRYARKYTIHFNPYPPLGLRVALDYYHREDEPDRYIFDMTISNISRGNLVQAQKLAEQIYNILYRHQYWLWK
jgi:hypothetical protein